MLSVGCLPPKTVQTLSPRTRLAIAAQPMAPGRQIVMHPISSRFGRCFRSSSSNDGSATANESNMRTNSCLPDLVAQLLPPHAPTPLSARKAQTRHALYRLAGSRLESANSLADSFRKYGAANAIAVSAIPSPPESAAKSAGGYPYIAPHSMSDFYSVRFQAAAKGTPFWLSNEQSKITRESKSRPS